MQLGWSTAPISALLMAEETWQESWQQFAMPLKACIYKDYWCLLWFKWPDEITGPSPTQWGREMCSCRAGWPDLWKWVGTSQSLPRQEAGPCDTSSSTSLEFAQVLPKWLSKLNYHWKTIKILVDPHSHWHLNFWVFFFFF